MSLRFFERDWRAGELRLLLAALLVAVACISSVGLFVDRLRQGLSQEATQLLGADRVIVSDEPLPPEWAARAAAIGLAVASTANFPSMLVAGGTPRLVSVKAVSEGYPLRGNLRLASASGQGDEPAQGIPAPGTLWVDAQLVNELRAGAQASSGSPKSPATRSGPADATTRAGPADSATRTGPADAAVHAELGDAAFIVTRAITLEPDRGASFVNFAPRALVRLDDLAATHLVQPASRVSYRLLLAGTPEVLSRFDDWAASRLGKGIRLESLENGRPELRSTLDRAEQFLALVALLSALIAAVAIALAARRFAERHLDGCAVMRAIGIRQRRLMMVLGLELVWVGLVGGVAGVALGWAVHQALVAAVASLMPLPLPRAGAGPVLQALVAGMVLLLGFGGAPFLRLAGVPPMRVLRREAGGTGVSPWLALALAVGAFAGLLAWSSGDRELALISLAGFAAAAAVFALAAWAVLRAAGWLRREGIVPVRMPALRLALAGWSRRPASSVAQTVALAVGLMALMLLTVTRTDLVEGWRRASPLDAPDHFVINIQPDQRAAVSASLAGAGIVGPELAPMVRGRLVSVNGRDIDPAQFANERTRRLVEREFNLSFMNSPPAHNRIVQGQWFVAGAMEASVEQGIAQTLGLAMGDELGFDLAGELRTVRITSVRKLAWDSMRVNFFVILSPQALRDAPQTWITAYRQPPGAPSVDAALVRAMPNLTVFDMGAMVRQVQSLLDQVIAAVQILFVLTLVAGVVVLYAALATSRDERVREAGVMRAIGASRTLLARAQRWELGLGGALAGMLAAAGALGVGWALARFAFQFDIEPRWWSLAWGMLAGAVVAVVAGSLGLRGVLNSPPLAALREL